MWCVQDQGQENIGRIYEDSLTLQWYVSTWRGDHEEVNSWEHIIVSRLADPFSRQKRVIISEDDWTS